MLKLLSVKLPLTRFFLNDDTHMTQTCTMDLVIMPYELVLIKNVTVIIYYDAGTTREANVRDEF